MVRRIIGKSVMAVTGSKVQEAVGALQLCAGHPVGVESAIHAMRGFITDDDSDGILLIDADNAFNRINRSAALWNIQYTCPSMKHIIINFYRTPTRIFMNSEGAFELMSQEGTTQGCPLAMAMYALALVPLFKILLPLSKQVWFADDATGCDTFTKLKVWFDALLAHGPRYGYYASPSKCILVAKPERIDQARAIFRGTGVVIQLDGSKDQLTQVGAQGVEIVTTGARHLGAAVGTPQYKHTYISKKVEAWVGAVKTLADIAMTEPQAAFAAYTHCLQSQWTFLCRTMPGTPELFQPLEDAIRKVFIAKLFRRDVSERERDLLSLPARLGGMGITKPTEEAAIASANSMYVSDPLVRLVARQEFALDPTALLDQIKKLRRDVDRRNDERHAQKRKVVLTDAPRDIIVAMDISSDKGSSNWVTAYPSYERHTDLSKGEFTDAVCMRYGWPIANIDTVCACGTNFSVEHALNCQYGGLRAIQHNEVRDVVGQCMKDAGYAHVEIEPRLQELQFTLSEYLASTQLSLRTLGNHFTHSE